MEAIKQDWLIRLYYDEEYIGTITTQKDILLPAITILKLFPELEESDYVIIRRTEALITYFQTRGVDYSACERIRAWLEKQDKQIEIYNQCTSKEIIHNIEDQPFTVDDFKPFDKVLVRDSSTFKWRIEIFSHYRKSSYSIYICVAGWYRQCIPYNDETKHLLETTEEYNRKYKTW